ncbi:PilZ domain-containing protein [Geobacter pelophilus]|uniref:PilZ domain-containing protein n=1 Tax=Geoanaerobacter pelophilus TaxID=60036 RepID=A0AAW4L581_9BACT|nr:PilZ domain-containing protein [Geoanaerobacter pelophilus]MBT0663381.1 PilZ domain-containing protein [Geoanaerobacter pelophilus]
MGEARRFTRIPYQSEVLMNANGQWFRGLSENLSLYGIYIKSNERLKLDSIVELTIYLPGSDDTTNDDNYIDVNSVVVRQDQEGIGCEFRQVDVDAFLNLKNVISSRCDNKTLVMDEFYSYLSRKELLAS